MVSEACLCPMSALLLFGDEALPPPTSLGRGIEPKGGMSANLRNRVDQISVGLDRPYGVPRLEFKGVSSICGLGWSRIWVGSTKLWAVSTKSRAGGQIWHVLDKQWDNVDQLRFGVLGGATGFGAGLAEFEADLTDAGGDRLGLGLARPLRAGEIKFGAASIISRQLRLLR